MFLFLDQLSALPPLFLGASGPHRDANKVHMCFFFIPSECVTSTVPGGEWTTQGCQKSTYLSFLNQVSVLLLPPLFLEASGPHRDAKKVHFCFFFKPSECVTSTVPAGEWTTQGCQKSTYLFLF